MIKRRFLVDVVRYMLSSIRLSSVTFVYPTLPFGTSAIYDLSVKILCRSSQGNPSVGGVKHKRGSRTNRTDWLDSVYCRCIET